MDRIIDLLKSEIDYFKKLKAAIGDLHGHIHSLAVEASKIYLAEKHSSVKEWKLSKKYGSGLDIIGVDSEGIKIVIAEVKTTFRSEKKQLGSVQRKSINKDVEKLADAEAKHKYFFIIDNQNRSAIEAILNNFEPTEQIQLVNIFEEEYG